jgi:hypothetical protein
MAANLSTNVGLANTASKQYAIVKQAASSNRKIDDEPSISSDKGNVYGEKIADMANPHIDEYVSALTEQDEASKAKKKYQPTVESLKERLGKSLEDRYDNAHNMLAEAFYGFKVNTCNSLLGLLGADPTELEAIKKKAYEQAKGKVQAGYERLAAAYAEYEIYAS